MDEADILIGAAMAWLLWPRDASADDGGDDDPTPQVLLTGELVVPEPERTLATVVSGLISSTPRPGAAYQGGQGELLYGPSGIIARALRHEDGLGRQPTATESTRYYAAIGRVRSNWRLYGTLANGPPVTPSVERYSILTAAGVAQTGTITAARCPWHESWRDATAAGRLPFRRIGWRRTGNACGGLRRVPGWGTGSKYGLLWLPPVSAMSMPDPRAVTSMPSMDWPQEVFDLAGVDWETHTYEPRPGE